MGVPVPGPVITRRMGARAMKGRQNTVRHTAPMLRRSQGTSEVAAARAMAARLPHRKPQAALRVECHRLRRYRLWFSKNSATTAVGGDRR